MQTFNVCRCKCWDLSPDGDRSSPMKYYRFNFSSKFNCKTIRSKIVKEIRGGCNTD